MDQHTITDSDDADPDRSCMACRVSGRCCDRLVSPARFTSGRDAIVNAAQRVVFGEFWCSIVNNLQPPAQMCARLSQV